MLGANKIKASSVYEIHPLPHRHPHIILALKMDYAPWKNIFILPLALWPDGRRLALG